MNDSDGTVRTASHHLQLYPLGCPGRMEVGDQPMLGGEWL